MFLNKIKQDYMYLPTHFNNRGGVYLVRPTLKRPNVHGYMHSVNELHIKTPTSANGSSFGFPDE